MDSKFIWRGEEKKFHAKRQLVSSIAAVGHRAPSTFPRSGLRDRKEDTELVQECLDLRLELG